MSNARTLAAATLASALYGASRRPGLRIALSLSSLVIVTLFGGLVLTSLWNWFAMPLVAHRIAYPEGVGLFLIALFFRAPWGRSPRRGGQDDLWDAARNTIAQIAVMAMLWAGAAFWNFFVLH